jgi:hypothetical protein
VSISYKIFTAENEVVAKVTGTLSFGAMTAYIGNLRLNSNYVQSMNSFYDLTNCTNILGELRLLSEFADILNNSVFDHIKSKTAIVIPDNNQKNL